MAWSGVILKLFDVGAIWAAIALLLNVFTGVSLPVGILISGGISLLYITFVVTKNIAFLSLAL